MRLDLRSSAPSELGYRDVWSLYIQLYPLLL